jgi:hypothetical protein
MTRIDYREYGRVFLPIFIKPINENTMLPISFKVDTGADSTTISKLDLLDLGYDIKWVYHNAVVFKDNHKPITASGEIINAGYVQLPIINILGYEGRCWPFQIIMNEEKDFRNLLGRDLLAGFNYEFNNDNDTFSIARTKKFNPRYKFLQGQEIHEMASF